MFNNWVDLVVEDFHLKNSTNAIGAVISVSDPLMIGIQTVVQNQRTMQGEIRSIYNKLSRMEENLSATVDCVLSTRQHLTTNDSSQCSSPRKRTLNNRKSSTNETPFIEEAINVCNVTNHVLKETIISGYQNSEIDDNTMKSSDNRYLSSYTTNSFTICVNNTNFNNVLLFVLKLF